MKKCYCNVVCSSGIVGKTNQTFCLILKRNIRSLEYHINVFLRNHICQTIAVDQHVLLHDKGFGYQYHFNWIVLSDGLGNDILLWVKAGFIF